MTAAVDATDLGRRYGKFWALRQATLRLPAGSITAVVGPNGAGKSTLLKTLIRALPISSGALTFGGNAVARMSTRAINIG